MAKKQEPDRTVLVIIGIIAVFLLFKTGFIGSFTTFCENTEPGTFTEFNQWVNEQNGSLSLIDTYEYDITANETARFDVYDVSSSLNPNNLSLLIMNTDTQACNYALALEKEVIEANNQTASYVTFNNKQILYSAIDTTKYYWCNKADNFMLITENLQVMSDYYAEFEVCETTETADNSNTNGSSVIFGDIGDDASSDEDQTAWDKIVSIKDDKKSMTFVLIAVLIVFGAYWYFEKGPDKGLIKKSQRKRKKTTRMRR